jgi:hypothetical protein
MATENTTPVILEHQEEMQAEVTNVVSVEISVVDQESYEKANQQIAHLQAVRKNVVNFFADQKKLTAAAHKAVCNSEKQMLDPVDTKIAALKGETTRWYTAEQARIAAEAERKRREAEELAKLAEEAEATGDVETAQEAVVEAAMAEANVTVMPKVSGTTMREVWKAEITDINAVPREYMMVNQAALDSVAKATKGTLNIPGVRFVKTYVNATRAKW